MDLFDIADINRNNSLDLFEFIKFMRIIDWQFKYSDIEYKNSFND